MKIVVFGVNICAILGAFMIGTGGHDIGKLFTMVRIPGNSSFERGVSRHGHRVHGRIIKRCKSITDKSLCDEIRATVIESWDGTKPKHINNETLRLVDEAKYDELQELIGTTPLSVSYDMEW